MTSRWLPHQMTVQLKFDRRRYQTRQVCFGFVRKGHLPVAVEVVQIQRTCWLVVGLLRNPWCQSLQVSVGCLLHQMNPRRKSLTSWSWERLRTLLRHQSLGVFVDSVAQRVRLSCFVGVELQNLKNYRKIIVNSDGNSEAKMNLPVLVAPKAVVFVLVPPNAGAVEPNKPPLCVVAVPKGLAPKLEFCWLA